MKTGRHRPVRMAGMGQRFPRISFDPQIMGGRPCLRSTRVTVSTVLGLMAAGRTHAEILKAYPYLEEGDLHESLAFAAWRAQEQELPLGQ